MKSIVIYRTKYIGPEILGHLFVLDETKNGGSTIVFECRTLELEWKNNEKNVSCVPSGIYDIEFEHSPKFKQNLWELKGVPNRSEVKIHVANYYTQLQGCIAVGDMHTNINSDKIPDVRNSRKTLNRLHSYLAPETQLTITIIGKELLSQVKQ